MSIKIFEGRIICSLCERLLEKDEPYKLDEFRYKIVCLSCDEKYNFSKDNLVKDATQLKQKMVDLIEMFMKENVTINIDMEKLKQLLIREYKNDK